MNKVILSGNLGKDPEMRFTPNGNPVTTFSLATTEYRKSDEGVKQVTTWHNIVCWNKLAENCNQYTSKGSKVLIEGKITTRSWEGDDGQKHYKTEIIANNVEFLDRKSEGSSHVDDEELPF